MKIKKLLELPFEINIDKSFDTKIDLIWKSSGHYETTSFTVNNIDYHISIVEKPVDQIPGLSNLAGKRTAELAFISGETNSPQYGTTKNAGVSVNKIYGIVLNAAIEKFPDYDAFIFIAKRGHSENDKQFKTKTRIYQLAAEKLAKMNNVFDRSANINGGVGFVVSKFPLDTNEWFNQWEQMILETKNVYS